MVLASIPLLMEKTFAARPVGAMSTSRCPREWSVYTMAEASDVLPVPAEPRITITASCLRSARKCEKTLRALYWSCVGEKPKLPMMRSTSS